MEGKTIEVESEEDELKCNICFSEWSFNQHDQTEVLACGYFICKQCLARVTFCPNCHIGLNAGHITRGKPRWNTLSSFKKLYKCPHFECKVMDKIADLPKHINDCSFAYCCPNEGCNVYTKKIHSADHKVNCQFKPISCPDCFKSVSQHSLQNHLDSECMKRLINCEYCGMQVFADGLSSHYDDICEEFLRLCNGPRCTEYVSKSDLKAHASTCPGSYTSCNLCGSTMYRFCLEEHQELRCEGREIVCRFCQCKVKKKDILYHLTHCVAKIYTCSQCNKRIQHKYAYVHATLHCPGRSYFCQERGCHHIMKASDEYKLSSHSCPQLEFCENVEFDVGLIMDVREDKGPWLPYIILKKEPTRLMAFLLPSNRSISTEIEYIYPTERSTTTLLAPGGLFSKHLIYSPGKNIEIPTYLFRRGVFEPFTTCDPRIYDDEQKVSDSTYTTLFTALVATKNAEKSYFVPTILLSGGEYIHHNTNEHLHFQNSTIVCEITHHFRTTLHIKHNNKHAVIPKCTLEGLRQMPTLSNVLSNNYLIDLHGIDPIDFDLFSDEEKAFFRLTNTPKAIRFARFIRTYLDLQTMTTFYEFDIFLSKSQLILPPYRGTLFKVPDTHIFLQWICNHLF